MVILISTSIILQVSTRWFVKSVRVLNWLLLLQVLVGAIFIYLGYINFDDTERQKRLNRYNNIATILVFLITILNVLISGFGISTEPSNT